LFSAQTLSLSPQTVERETDRNAAQQTGFATTLVGSLLYYLTLGTVLFVHFCLVLTCISYYANDNDCGGWTLESNYQQALLAFEIVWMVGAAYMLVLKWPTRLRLHFWLRVSLENAEFVRVWSPEDKNILAQSKDVMLLQQISHQVVLVEWCGRRRATPRPLPIMRLMSRRAGRVALEQVLRLDVQRYHDAQAARAMDHLQSPSHDPRRSLH
jgi:hypothetical protein